MINYSQPCCVRSIFISLLLKKEAAMALPRVRIARKHRSRARAWGKEWVKNLRSRLIGVRVMSCFFTGVGIGAEWGVGTSLLQEVWPEKWRTKGAGLLQSGFSVGGVLISGVWILVGSTLGLSWRWMYLFGIVPLIILAFVHKSI